MFKLFSKIKTSSQKILFCDIDGTVNYHCKRIRKWTIPKWPGYKINPKAFTREEIMKEEPIEDSIESLKNLSHFYKIKFLSARNFPDAYNITADWLDVNCFTYDELLIVKKPLDKIEILKKHKDCLFIDDLQRGHQYEQTEFYNDVIFLLKKHNIRFKIFCNNWKHIVLKYGNK